MGETAVRPGFTLSRPTSLGTASRGATAAVAGPARGNGIAVTAGPWSRGGPGSNSNSAPVNPKRSAANPHRPNAA